MPERYDGQPTRRAMVTGASSGIGEATARLIASAGVPVALVARREEILHRLAAELAGAIAVPADVADDDAVHAAIEHAEASLGPIDLLINCAGIIGPTPLEDLTPEIWRHTIAVNLSGTYYTSRELGLRMRSRSGGDIINVASDLAYTAMPGYADYCAAKSGVVGLTRALASELAPTVRVNAVAPGPVDTPMMDHELEMSADPAASRSATIRRVPLRRIAHPDEVARAIWFLATGATYTTGSVLGIDGGVTALSPLSGEVFS